MPNPFPVFVQVKRVNDLGQLMSIEHSFNPVTGNYYHSLTCANNFNHLRMLLTSKYHWLNQPIEYYIGDKTIAFMRFKKRGLI